MEKVARSNMLSVVVTALFLGSCEAVNNTTAVVSNSQVERIQVRKMTKRSKYDEETLNCSKQADFNITLAIERGIELQAEVCSWSCYGNSNSGTMDIGSHCLSTLLSCPLCYCDSSCSLYGDCCIHTGRNMSTNQTHSASSSSQPSYSCFYIDKQTAVYIIASCPARATSSLGDINPSNLIQQPSHTHSNTTPKLKAYKADVQCNKCLFSPESIRLVTSATTGNTYCNSHCLHCNEGPHAEDADFMWREIKSCIAQDDVTEEDSTNENITGSAHVDCQTVYKQPDTVNTRLCDSQITSKRGDTIVDTCKVMLLEVACNLSWSVVEELEQLCQLYKSPVHEGDVIYQNIFCYLCQGQFPMTCWGVELPDHPPIVSETDVNLSTLTDMSGNTDQVKIEQSQPEDANNWGQASEVNCEQDHWRDHMKETCLTVICAPGRALTNKTASFEAYCQVEDHRDANDIYKLFVTVYIPKMDESSSRNSMQDFYSINNQQIHSSEKICSNSQCINETYLEFEDVTSGNEGFANALTQEFNALCSEVRNIYGNKDYLPLEDTIKQNKHEEFMFEKFVNHLPTVRGRTMSEVVQASPDVHNDSMYESISQRIVREVHATKKVNKAMYKRYLIHPVNTYIVSGLKSLGVAEYALQIHGAQTSTTHFQNKQTPGYPEDVAESSHCESQSSIGAIVFMRLLPGTDRDVFESNILHHFNGMKDIVMDTTVVNVEMVLSSSGKMSLIAGQPVYYSNSLIRECRVFTEPDQMTQVFGDLVCSGGRCKVVPFNLVSSCPHVTLNISELSISKYCELAKDGMTIRKSQFVRENEKIYICRETMRSLFVSKSDIHKVLLISIIESLLTLTSLTMSLICLLMTFITYVTFPTMRSLPGKNNLILVVWLFVAQLLVLLHTVPTKHSTACSMLGVLLHYSWLFTVLWMCVCSFHMFHVFVIRRGVPSSSRSDTFYLTRYIITCTSIAIVIVLSVVLSKVYMSNYDNIGYGGHVCYLNSNVLVGVAFVLPLSVVLLFNLFVFSVTVYTISRIEDVKKHSGRERRNVHIYFRLSSLTGLCWVLALLAEIPGLRPLRCFSILVNGSQGVALFLSYVCNRRVARMWLHLLRSRSAELNKKPADTSRQVTWTSSQ